MLIEGVVVLPVGSEIELTHPNVNAVVNRVRLRAGVEGADQYRPHVILDVTVPQEWYDE